MKYRMEIQFALHETFAEIPDESLGKLTERARELGVVFKTAFVTEVLCTFEDDWATYIFTVDDTERARAIQEMLEWITTANVLMYEVN